MQKKKTINRKNEFLRFKNEFLTFLGGGKGKGGGGKGNMWAGGGQSSGDSAIGADNFFFQNPKNAPYPRYL